MCLDDEMWRQAYLVEFLTLVSQWITPGLFTENVHEAASMGPPSPGCGELYAGWDIARSQDLSVLWFVESLGDVTWTRGVIEWKNVSTPDQTDMVRALLKSGAIRRLCIDKSGMGLPMCETLQREFGEMRVEGVVFTSANKEMLATLQKSRMEGHKCRLPDDDRVRYSFHSVKKTASATGQARFDAEHDEKHGHADHWWASCLAENAAHTPTTHLTEIGGTATVPILAGMMSRKL